MVSADGSSFDEGLLVEVTDRDDVEIVDLDRLYHGDGSSTVPVGRGGIRGSRSRTANPGHARNVPTVDTLNDAQFTQSACVRSVAAKEMRLRIRRPGVRIPPSALCDVPRHR
jgi:hypothetical protein